MTCDCVSVCCQLRHLKISMHQMLKLQVVNSIALNGETFMAGISIAIVEC